MNPCVIASIDAVGRECRRAHYPVAAEERAPIKGRWGGLTTSSMDLEIAKIAEKKLSLQDLYPPSLQDLCPLRTARISDLPSTGRTATQVHSKHTVMSPDGIRGYRSCSGNFSLPASFDTTPIVLSPESRSSAARGVNELLDALNRSLVRAKFPSGYLSLVLRGRHLAAEPGDLVFADRDRTVNDALHLIA